LIDNADRGMPLLVLLVMLQLILCGGLFPVQGRAELEQLSWLVPTRWAYAMSAATVDLNRLPTSKVNSSWNHTVETWTIATFALGAIGLALILVTAVLLRRRDPNRRGR